MADKSLSENLDSATKAMTSLNDSLRANVALTEARNLEYLKDLDTLTISMVKMHDSLVRSGKSAKEITEILNDKFSKALEGHKRTIGDSSAYIASQTSILSRSLRSLADVGMKQMTGSLGAFGAALSSLPLTALTAGVAGSALALKMYVDALAQVNKSAYALSAASGGFAHGGYISPSQKQKDNIFDARQALISMNFSNEQIGSIFGAAGKFLPRNVSGNNAKLMTGLAAQATENSISPEKMLEWAGSLARSNIDLVQFQKNVTKTADDFGDMPTEELLEDQFALWQSSRRLGLSFDGAKKVIDSYHAELKSQIYTAQDLATLADRARQPVGTDLAQIALMRQAGTLPPSIAKIPGTLEQGSAFALMARDPKGMREAEKALQDAIRVLAGRQPGGANIENLKIWASTALGTGLPQASKDIAIFGRTMEETSTAMQKMVPIAEDVFKKPADDLEKGAIDMAISLRDSATSVEVWTKSVLNSLNGLLTSDVVRDIMED